MEKAQEKAAVLIEALPYIQSFQKKYLVMKLGGSGLTEREALRGILRDIVFLRVAGMYPVIVHGGGPFISQAMAEAGIEPKFVSGHRVTDEKTIEIVERVLLKEVNWNILKELTGLGGKGAPLHVRLIPFMQAERKRIAPDGGGEPVDLGLVGDVTEVTTEFIEELCQVGRIPVIAPMALGPDGELLNVNADSATSAIAVALKAEKLVVFTNVPGVMLDPDDPGSLLSTLHGDDVENYIKQGVIRGGMLPKVKACLAAIRGGVNKAHVVDTRLPHSLLLEIFTDAGIGTQILQ